MNTVLKLLRLNYVPVNLDVGLLVLRVWLGLSMLLLHGWPKLMKFAEMSEKFADPFGLGAKASLVLAIFGELVGAALVALGFLTRLGAFTAGATMAVAFIHAHNMVLKGPGSGELAFIYLAGFVAIFLAGPGRFALDAKWGSTK